MYTLHKNRDVIMLHWIKVLISIGVSLRPNFFSQWPNFFGCTGPEVLMGHGSSGTSDKMFTGDGDKLFTRVLALGDETVATISAGLYTSKLKLINLIVYYIPTAFQQHVKNLPVEKCFTLIADIR